MVLLTLPQQETSVLVSYEHKPHSGIQGRYGESPAQCGRTVEAEIMVILIAGVLNLLVALLELLLAFK